MVLETDFKTSYMLGKCSTSEPHLPWDTSLMLVYVIYSVPQEGDHTAEGDKLSDETKKNQNPKKPKKPYTLMIWIMKDL